MMRRWTTSMGGRASWCLYNEPHLVRRMLVDQICSESPTHTFGNERWLHEWAFKFGAKNHCNDGIQMAAVAAIDVPGE